MILEATEITKSIQGRGILCQVDISVHTSEIVAVIGPSGAGKSTLLRALSLIDPPDSGEISFGPQRWGFPISGPLLPPWPEVTVVFQQHFLWPHLSVKENITLPLHATGRLKQLERLNSYAVELGVEECLLQLPNRISVGQRQRAALLRAMLIYPQFILIDEITSALDIETIWIVQKCLRSLCAQGIGIIVVTHNIEFAHNTASRVVMLDKGSVVESGPVEILKAPQSARLNKFLNREQSAHSDV